MSITALRTVEITPVEEALSEIAESETALGGLLHRAERLHTSRIAHDPTSCLICFSQR